MWGKRHGYRCRADTPKLDAVEPRRAARYDRVLEAQLTQGRPAARHQPFAARLVARKILLVDNDYPKATSRGKERRRGTGGPGPKHRDIGVEGCRQAFRARAFWFRRRAPSGASPVPEADPGRDLAVVS